MVSPEETPAKLSEYLNYLDKNKLLGAAESCLSVGAAALGCWAIVDPNVIFNPELESTSKLIPFMLLTPLTCVIGAAGVVDGIVRMSQSSKSLEKAKKEISSRQFKIRGFFLNRTVAA